MLGEPMIGLLNVPGRGRGTPRRRVAKARFRKVTARPWATNLANALSLQGKAIAPVAKEEILSNATPHPERGNDKFAKNRSRRSIKREICCSCLSDPRGSPGSGL